MITSNLNKLLKLINKQSILEILFSLILFYVYLYVVENFFPSGINQIFASRMQTVIYYVSITFLLFLFSIFVFKSVFKNAAPYHFRELENVKNSDFLLLLLPLSPILQYIVLNQDTLSIYGNLYVLIISLVILTFIVIFIPVLLSIFVSRILLMSVGLSLSFLLIYVPILAFDYLWHQIGPLKIQLPTLFILFVGIYLLYKINDKFLKIVILIFFLSTLLLSIITLAKKEQGQLTELRLKNNLVDEIIKTPMKVKPDIYLLTYDGYVVNETMLGYGIDNSPQEKYLEDKGFQIYPNTYSIDGATLGTMTRILNMSDIYPRLGSQVIGGKSNVHKILEHNGYIRGGVMKQPKYWEKETPLLDFYYPPLVDDGHKIILKAILEGEFDYNAPAKFVKRNKADFISMKRKFMSSSTQPKFLYTHTGPGHSQNSGKCRHNETERWERKLATANQEMKKDIETIEKNNPNALIIINGDHGPYLTKNCLLLGDGAYSIDEVTRLDVQDRYGTFLAIKWPKNINILDKNITVIQDVFPAIFASLSNNRKIFDKVKITPLTVTPVRTGGVKVRNKIIIGGKNDGEPLFTGVKK